MSAYDVHPRIKAASVEAIKSLGLAGDGIFGEIGQRVFSQLFPDDNGIQGPCILMTTEGLSEEKLDGDSVIQRWRYPNRIWIWDSESPRKHEKETLYLCWRKAIIRLFDQKNPVKTAVPEAEGCEIVPDVIFDEKLPQYQHIVSGMVLWVSTSEER